MFHNVPTVAESGLAGYEVTQWSGMLAPAATPAIIIARLNAEVERILQKPLIRERLVTDCVTPGGGSAQHFGEFIRDDIVKWSKVVRGVGLVRKDVVKWRLHFRKVKNRPAAVLHS